MFSAFPDTASLAQDRRLLEKFVSSHRVSEPTANMLSEAIDLLAKGDEVGVVSMSRMLTSNEASDVLNVSRQYLMRLLGEDQIPFEKVGTHHRIRASDVLAFKRTRDAKRKQGLRDLIAMTEEYGGYDDD